MVVVQGSPRGCCVQDPRASASRSSAKSTRHVLPVLPVVAVPPPPPPRTAAEPPAPRPSAPPADASEGPRGRWQHLVAEWSPAAGLCQGPVTGWLGSTLPTGPGPGTHGQPQPAQGRVGSGAAQGGHAVPCFGDARMVGGHRGDRQPRRVGVCPRAQPWQEPFPNICFQLRAVGTVFLGCCSVLGGPPHLRAHRLPNATGYDPPDFSVGTRWQVAAAGPWQPPGPICIPFPCERSRSS